MVVTITRDGFIKRTPLETFRQQNRGGRGRSAAGTRGDDIVTRSFNAHTHQWVLFFSSGGKAFREKVWRLPEGGPTGKGRALVNLLPELGSDQITTVLPLPQDESLWDSLHLVFATAQARKAANVKAMLTGQLTVQRAPLLPRLLTLTDAQEALRKPFKPPVAGSTATGPSGALLARSLCLCVWPESVCGLTRAVFLCLCVLPHFAP